MAAAIRAGFTMLDAVTKAAVRAGAFDKAAEGANELLSAPGLPRGCEECGRSELR